METDIHFRPIPTTLEELKSAYKRLPMFQIFFLYQSEPPNRCMVNPKRVT
jgi:hypothetical protein